MNNTHNRQMGIIDPARLNIKIAVIGAGSIGSWTILALSKMGCSDITVYDFDIVSEVNVGSQIYTIGDIDDLKVDSLQNKIRVLTGQEIKKVADRANESILEFDIVIFAVDNIESRTELFGILKSRDWNGTLIDARMAGNVLEIYTTKMSNTTEYEASLFPAGEASIVECSERSVVYNVFIVGGLVTDIVKRIVKEETIPQELYFDLNNFYLTGGLI